MHVSISAPTLRRLRRAWSVWPVLLAVVLLAGYLRGLRLSDWDSGTGQHPDERFFTQVATTVRLPASPAEFIDSARSPLNPRSYHDFGLYVYGPFPISLTRLTAVWLTPPELLPDQVLTIDGRPRVGADPNAPTELRTSFGVLTPNPERALPRSDLLIALLNPDRVNLTSYGEIVKVGRSLALLFDLGSVLLTFAIARRLFGARTALLAALLSALTVMQIQQSHFFVDPVFSTFFALLTLYAGVRTTQQPTLLNYALIGISVGLAMANRITMATLGLLAVAAALPVALRAVNGDRRRWWAQLLRHELPRLVLAGVLALVVFRTLAPDAFVGSSAPDQPITGAHDASSRLDVLQGTGWFDVRFDPRFVDDLQTVQRLVSGEYDFPPSQQWVDRADYVFPWRNLVLFGMGPALGLTAWAAWLLIGWRGGRKLWQALHGTALHWRRPGLWLLWLWVAFYFGWQGGQFAITMRYLLPIYGALLIPAAWLLRTLPRLLRRQLPTLHRRLQSPLRLFIRALLPLVLFTTAGWAYAFSRIYTVPHSRVQAADWLVEHAEPGSAVLWESWDDPLPLQTTNASWGIGYVGIRSEPYAEDDPQKYLGPDGLLDQLDQVDYITLTSNRVYDSTSRLRMRYPALMRYYHHLFTGNLGFELVADVTSYPRIFGIRIPDQIAEEAFTVYDHPRVLIFRKTAGYSRDAAEQLLTADVNWGEVYKSPVQIADRNPTALRFTDSQWPLISGAGDWWATLGSSTLAPLLWFVWVETLGIALFVLIARPLRRLPDAGFSLARVLGPVLIAYAAWILGSLQLAPFSPTTLRLLGLLLIAAAALTVYRRRDELHRLWRERRATLLRLELIWLAFVLLGLLLRWFNPDLWHPARGGEKPMDFALLNAVLRSGSFPPADPWHAGGYVNYYYAGFVVVGALVHLSGVAPAVGYNLAVATVFGLTAAAAAGLVFNLLAPRLQQARLRFGRATAAAVAAPVLLLLSGNLAQPGWLLNGYAAEQLLKGRVEWAFWDATRLIPGTVNEFPFFTFLFGDLHAHMMVMPLSLTLLGLALAIRRVPFSLLLWGAATVLLGLIRATNSWDYPTYGALFALLTWDALRAALQQHGRPLLPAALLAGTAVATLLVLSNLAIYPFLRDFASASDGLTLWLGGGVSLFEQLARAERTTTGQLIQMHGQWLWFALAILTADGWYRSHRREGPGVLPLHAWLPVLLQHVLLVLLVLAAWWLDLPALLVLLVLTTVALGRLLESDARPTAWRVSLLLLTAALGLLLLVELVTVRGDVGRMNTVFKFGLQSWTWFALATALALPQIAVAAFRLPRNLQWAGLTLAGIMPALMLAYPLTATPARWADRWNPDAPHGLDGQAYMATITAAQHGSEYALDSDLAGIDWLRRNAVGTPVIVEAHAPSYQWAGRISAATGLPTILGWEWHQIQQRNVVNAEPVIRYRQRVVNEIYSSAEAQLVLRHLQDYGVRYVYVGAFERTRYPAEGLAVFEALSDAGALLPVFDSGATRIYEVRQRTTPTMLTNDLPIEPPTVRTLPEFGLLTPVNELPAVTRMPWAAALAQSQPAAVAVWLLLMGLLTLAGAVPARLAFGVHGLGWARPLGWLLSSWLVWLPVSLGLWAFDVAALAFSAGVLALVGWWGIDRLRDTDWRRAWRSARGAELAFVLGFTLMLALRAVNPDLWHPVWGGEKPMEQGFLNALLRTPTLPPPDPFFSDGRINYYYYGFMLFAVPLRLSGIEPAIGFNLALATVAGLLFSAAYQLGRSVGGNRWSGLLAIVLIALVGNFASALQVGWSRGWSVLAALRQAGPAQAGQVLGDWFIGPSRVIDGTINEFPAFSLLYADLHPHVIALPIFLLAMAAAYRLQRGSTAWPQYALAALVLGTLAVTNSWDAPTTALLYGLSLTAAFWRAAGGYLRQLPVALLRAAALTLLILLGGLAAYAPFFDFFTAMVGGVGLVRFEATALREWLVVGGLPLLLLTAWVLFVSGRLALREQLLWLLALLLVPVTLFLFPAAALRVLLAAVGLLVLRLLTQRLSLNGHWTALLWLGAALAVALGSETVYIRDHLDGSDFYRMNTVFKFGMQIWLLLAAAAAVIAPALWRALPGTRWRVAAAAALALPTAAVGSYLPLAVPSRIDTRIETNAGMTLDGMAFLDGGRFVYDCGVFGGCEMPGGQLSIDLSGDAAAIDWLNRSVNGMPIVVQSNLWFYRAYGIRVAAATGLPTVISALHANEQHDPARTARRDRDIETLYRTDDIDAALRILARYDVNYVYVGAIEHAFYPRGVQKFARMSANLLPVFDRGGVQIYAVANIPSTYREVLPERERAPYVSPALGEPPEIGAALDAGTAFAVAQSLRAAGDLAAAAEVLGPAAQDAPQDVGLHHLLGDILLELGDFDGAQQAYQQAVSIAPTADNYTKLGAGLVRMNRFDAAAQALEQALVQNPTQADAHFFLALVTDQRGDTQTAIGHLTASLEAAPQGLHAAEARGLLLELARRDD